MSRFAIEVRYAAAIGCALLLGACGGGKEADWLKAKRVEASGTASGIAFTIQVPEGFKRGGDDKFPEWQDAADTIGFQVSATDPIDSVEAAIGKISLPDDTYTFEKKAALPDGFVVRRTSGPDGGVAFVDVFKRGRSGNLQCHGGAQASGRNFADLPGTLAAMEEVCTSLQLK